MISGVYKIFFHTGELVGQFTIKKDDIIEATGIADDLPIGPIDRKTKITLATMNNGYYYVVPPEDLGKSLDQLAKGAIRRLHGKFNPRAEEYKPVKRELEDWQTYGGLTDERGQGMGEAEQTPNERARAFNKLAAATSMRRNQRTGEREFLLHRGVGAHEREETVGQSGNIYNEKHSSWTPHHEVAKEFAADYSGFAGDTRGDVIANNPEHIKNHVLTAWIPESKIKGIPNQLGSVSHYKNEHEVIVHPHATKLEQFTQPPPKDVTARLNQRRPPQLKIQKSSTENTLEDKIRDQLQSGKSPKSS